MISKILTFIVINLTIKFAILKLTILRANYIPVLLSSDYGNTHPKLLGIAIIRKRACAGKTGVCDGKGDPIIKSVD